MFYLCNRYFVDCVYMYFLMYGYRKEVLLNILINVIKDTNIFINYKKKKIISKENSKLV